MTKQALFLLVGIFLMCGVVGGLLYNASLSGSEVRVLRLPHTQPKDHPVHKSIQYFADSIRELSDSKIIIQIYPSALLGGEAQIKELMQHGVTDIGKFSASAFEDNIPEMAAYSLPYIFRDSEHYWRVLNSKFGQEILDAGYNTPAALKGLAYYDAGARSFYSIGKAGPMRNPEELRGKKVRVMSTRLMTEAVRALGGNPVPAPFSELYSALQMGVIEAAENNIPSYYTNAHYDVCPNLTLSEHFRCPDVLVMSRQAWESLTPEYQEMVMVAAKASAEYLRELWEAETNAELADLRNRGVKIYEADQEALAKASLPFYELLAKDPSRKRTLEVAKIIREMEAE